MLESLKSSKSIQFYSRAKNRLCKFLKKTYER